MKSTDLNVTGARKCTCKKKPGGQRIVSLDDCCPRHGKASFNLPVEKLVTNVWLVIGNTEQVEAVCATKALAEKIKEEVGGRVVIKEVEYETDSA